MGLSNEAFAKRLGIGLRTVADWHRKPTIRPQSGMQEVLDAAFEEASPAVKARFAGGSSEQDTTATAAEHRLSADPNISAALECSRSPLCYITKAYSTKPTSEMGRSAPVPVRRESPATSLVTRTAPSIAYDPPVVDLRRSADAAAGRASQAKDTTRITCKALVVAYAPFDN